MFKCMLNKKKAIKKQPIVMFFHFCDVLIINLLSFDGCFN